MEGIGDITELLLYNPVTGAEYGVIEEGLTVYVGHQDPPPGLRVKTTANVASLSLRVDGNAVVMEFPSDAANLEHQYHFHDLFTLATGSSHTVIATPFSSQMKAANTTATAAAAAALDDANGEDAACTGNEVTLRFEIAAVLDDGSISHAAQRSSP